MEAVLPEHRGGGVAKLVRWRYLAEVGCEEAGRTVDA